MKNCKKPLDLTKKPLWLFIDTDYEELNELGLNNEISGYNFEFPDKMLDLFKRLRITLKTPEGGFEAMPSPDHLSTGEISFVNFYPADLGPLATDDSVKLSKGFMLALRSDPEKLSEIKARFVLAEEELKEVQA